MRERRGAAGLLDLNLENLEREDAPDCPYILTSPRSLQACKLMGVKPVELLYRSVNEVREHLSSSASLERVITVYRKQEKTRRSYYPSYNIAESDLESKLEACRAVRAHLVALNPTPSDHLSPSSTTSPECSFKENLNPTTGPCKTSAATAPAPPPPPEAVKRSSSSSDGDNRLSSLEKDSKDRENNKERARNSEETLRAVENKGSWTGERGKNSQVTLNLGTSSPSGGDSKQTHQLPVVSSSTTKKRIRTTTTTTTTFSRATGRPSSSTSSSRCADSPPLKHLPSVQPPARPPPPTRPKSSPSPSTASRPVARPHSSSSSSNTYRPTPPRRPLSSTSTGGGGTKLFKTRICPRTWGAAGGGSASVGGGGGGASTDRNNNNSNNSSSSSITFSSAKRILEPSARKKLYSVSSAWHAEGLHVPEHDRRILESMAMKREAEREAEEMAHEAHLAWEQDRKQREQEQWEECQRIRERVAEKRRLEGEHNERKLAEIREEKQRAQQRLQQSLLEKEERATQMLKSAEGRKCGEQGERVDALERQRAMVLSNHEHLEDERAIWRLAVQQTQDERLRRAEKTRHRNRESTRRRVSSANRVEEVRHAERRRVLQAEAEAALRMLRQQCLEKARRAEQLQLRASGERERQLRGLSEARAQREQNARQLHAELEAGLVRWRLQCAQLQREAAVRAERRATQQYRERQQRAETANRAREEHHSIIMSRVSADQRALEEARRSAILAKEAKMRRLQHQREQAVTESRVQAHTTAELRDEIRRTMSPETFDRLVARSALEARVTASRPQQNSTAPPERTRSHILLG